MMLKRGIFGSRFVGRLAKDAAQTSSGTDQKTSDAPCHRVLHFGYLISEVITFALEVLVISDSIEF